MHLAFYIQSTLVYWGAIAMPDRADADDALAEIYAAVKSKKFEVKRFSAALKKCVPSSSVNFQPAGNAPSCELHMPHESAVASPPPEQETTRRRMAYLNGKYSAFTSSSRHTRCMVSLASSCNTWPPMDVGLP